MIKDLVTEKNYIDDIVCETWEELVDIVGAPLVAQGDIEPQYLKSIKETVYEFGSYMVVVDDLVFFHGRPDAGVNRMALNFGLLREPVYLNGKRIKAAFVFAAVDNNSHLDLIGELSGFLMDEQFLSLIRNHGSKEEIMKKFQEGAEISEV